jgi:hypothetical protein
MYSQSQSYLYPYYTSLLEGTNSYASPIGNWGGQELEDIIGLSSKNMTNAVNSSLASSGMARSGLAAEAIGSKIGDLSTQYRWEDYNRALEGRMNLINTGSQGLSNLSSRALNNQNQQNNFNVGNYEFQANQEAQEEANEQAMWSIILSSAIGAGTSMYGMNYLGNAMKASSAVNSSMGGIK